MIEKGQILTGNDAELLTCALSEVKTKVYEESEDQLDDTHALDALVSCFRSAANDGQDRRHMYFSPLRKRLVLGTIIDMKGSAYYPIARPILLDKAERRRPLRFTLFENVLPQLKR